MSTGRRDPFDPPVADVPRPRRTTFQDEEEAGMLSPLEKALVDRFESFADDVVHELRALRTQAPNRELLYVVAGLWVILAFVIAILALNTGVDPRIAKEAIPSFSAHNPAGD